MLALCLAAALAAVAEPGRAPETRVVRGSFSDPSALRNLPPGLDLWAVYPRQGFFLAEVTPEQEAALARAGFRVEPDPRRTALALHPPLATLGPTGATLGQTGATLGQTDGIPGFSCYRTVEETLDRGAALAAAHPGLATWIDVGDSWEKTVAADGYDLRVLKLTRASVPGPKPIVFIVAAMHAREYTTAELALRFADDLLDRYDRDPDVTWLLDQQEIHILLQSNPDGRKRAEGGLLWRKNTNNLYCPGTDQRGADLNRNFSFEWGCCGGSEADTCSEIYRGAAAASEPEVDAIESYARSLFPDQRDPGLLAPAPDTATGLLLDLHSPGETVLGSWGFSSDAIPAPNDVELRTLGRKYAFFGNYYPFQGSFGVVDGATKDFAYGELGVPGYTIELGMDFFETCAFFESTLVPSNLEALVAIAKHAREPYRTPSGPDAVGVALPPQAVAAGTVVPVTATLDDTRYSATNGVEPTQAIAGAELYVDVPPWSPSSVALAMNATDGAFDEPVEAVELPLGTSGLAIGRHFLYVRGQDADGHGGAVSAAFLDVIDPLTAPRLPGFVRDRASGAPLAAAVQLGRFATTSSPATGAFTLQVPAGAYSLTVTAPGHAPGTASLSLAANEGARRTVFLPAYATLSASDAEGAADGWTADPPWATTDEAAFSGTRSWTDSPGGPYTDNVDASLTSPLLDLSGFESVVLDFRQIYDIGYAFDLGQVEVSTDGGASWTRVAAYTGEGHTVSWEAVELPLPSLTGVAAARVRFHLLTDLVLTFDGWHLDDIVLRAAPRAGLLFADGFETGDFAAWSVNVP